MKVSLILETNQSAEFLDRQLQSISKQNHLPDEVIIVNKLVGKDQDLIREFKQQSPFEVFILDGNSSLVDALKIASGDILVFSAPDHILYSTKVKKVHDLFDQEPMLRLVFSNGEVINETDQLYIPDYLGITGFYEHWDFFKELSSTLLKKQEFVPLAFLSIDRKFLNNILAFFEDFPTYQIPIPLEEFISVFFGLLYEPESIREIPYVLNQIRISPEGDTKKKSESLKPFSMGKASQMETEQKEEKIKNFINWLTNYRDLVLLVDSKHSIIEQIDANIQFQNKRLEQVKKGRAQKIGFALQHLISGDYRKFTSDSYAEFILDII